MRIKSFVFFILFTVFTCNVIAQTPLFKNFKEGLASSEVYDCIEDNLGYLLLATENGINRFDGYKFTGYTVSEGLSDNTIVEFYKDLNNRVWYRPLIGPPGYVFNGIIFRLPESFASLSVNSIVGDKNGNIYFGIVNGYLKVDGHSLKANIHYLTSNRDSVDYSKHLLYFCGMDKDGNLWGSQFDRQIVIHNDSVKYFWKRNFFGMYKHTLTRILDFKLFNKFISYKNDNIFFDYNSIFYKKVEFILKLLINNIITFISEDKNGNIWVGTYNNGSYFFKEDFLTTLKFSHYFDKFSISSLMEDREGNYWVTTIGNGIFFISSQKYFVYTTKFGLSENNIICLVGDNKSNLWLGLNNGYINELVKDSIFVFNLKDKFNFSYRTMAILFHKNGSMWFGTDKGVFINSNNNFSQLVLSPSKGRDATKCLTQSFDGSVWVGTNLTIYKTNGRTFEDFEGKIGILPCRITSLTEGSDSTLWIGSEKGLYSFKNGNLLFSVFNKNRFLNRITKLKHGNNMICATTKNYGFFIMKDNKIFNFNEHDGLSSNICLSFIIDNDSTFWITTNKGLNKLTIRNIADKRFFIKTFNIDNGFASNEINDIYKRGDTLWLATSGGLSYLTEKSISFQSILPPPIYLSGFKVNNRDTTKLLNYTLKYYQNDIKLNFIGLSFKSNGQIKYKYKMEGLDSKWNYTSFTSLQYPSLPAGSYTFYITAINVDNVESRIPVKIGITILPAFYQTWWFMTLIILLIIGILALFFYWRFSLYKRQEAEKHSLNQILNDTELRALRSQMNPHFIFNCMNSIQSFIIKNEAEAAHNYLSKFSRLMRNVLDNSKAANISIEQEIITLKLYMDLESLRFENAFDYDIQLDAGLDSQFTVIPSMLIQPYIENAIWHGLMHKGSKGRITLKFEKAGEHFLKCIIEDNGIGRKRSGELKSLNEHNHKSLGMLLTKERLEIMNLTQSNELSLQIIDLIDKDGIALGTKVEISIPIL